MHGDDCATNFHRFSLHQKSLRPSRDEKRYVELNYDNHNNHATQKRRCRCEVPLVTASTVPSCSRQPRASGEGRGRKRGGVGIAALLEPTNELFRFHVDK